MLSTVRDIFYSTNKPALRLFSSILSVEDQDRLHCNIQIVNEASLRTYEKSVIEIQVVDIINRLSKIVQDPKQFQLEQGIIFENDLNSLNEIAEKVQERLHIQFPRTSSSIASSFSSFNLKFDSDSKSERIRVDQYCIYKKIESERQLLFVVKYKSPHKLSVGNLSRFRSMNVKKKIIDRIHIPSLIPLNAIEEDVEQSKEIIEKRLQYNANKVSVIVTTQTFHYMIENRLEYSYIIIEKAFVFLRIDWDDLITLLYHVTMSTDEVDDERSNLSYSQTIIAQILDLCLLTFKSERRDHVERKNAKKKLEKHSVTSLETVNHQTSASERQLEARKKRARKSSLYKEREKVSVISEYNLRSKCKSDDLSKNFDDEQHDHDESNSLTRSSASSSKSSRRKLSDQRKYEGRNNSNQASSSRGTQRQYCTQRCLLSIVRGWSLDKNCLNASLHVRRGRKHAIDQSKFLDLIQKQLTENLDHNCQSLGLHEARGALFQVTLASHGYVFVSKGTMQAFVPDLRHEKDVYRRLTKLQGAVVSMCLGNIDLTEWYNLDVKVEILHMLLLS